MSKTEFCEWAHIHCPARTYKRCPIRPEAEILKEKLGTISPRSEESITIQNRLRVLAETFCEEEERLIKGIEIEYEDHDPTLIDWSQNINNQKLLRLLSQEKTKSEEEDAIDIGRQLTEIRSERGEEGWQKIVSYIEGSDFQGTSLDERVLGWIEQGFLHPKIAREILKNIKSLPFSKK
ncbi:MAG: hypothetical protein UV56_C0028G0010 [Candidatus Woesebacteria bacterium GW2011_GWC1_43_10b]|uniref:Uncharacterized protein n=2 Tax=Candidatus Woeseibacteriota TaxID=1752722 RepID=A0A0G1GG08_9BACT|nr:MAG: hypothetical protein UV56_C0028G0010 [Candidatus Woesebacteria bacterium GW2011_GWC1_43_10b]KKT33455.1 MAG: hypothetical protein UW21_C0011G0007 [Candidatus Woesebacteria bacterium GW2011_GWB1_44_11b]